MVMTKPAAKPIQLADMGRQEAEQVTQAIKDNFDSLGAMLIQARDRKAYRALGYRSFESYCQSEFGKSVSGAYQLIEDAKVLSQLEARVSENYSEQVTLNFPASHLRPLKAVEDIDDKIKAIEYAQKLAAAQNRKATKKDLEIAVFQVSGKRSDNLKSAIEGLGFVQGTPVEIQNPLKKDRGVIRRIDKSGKIYVELYYHSAKAIPFNPEELRILSDKEKPTNPLEGSIANKGDRVLIFAKGLEGKKGTIFSWSESKQVLVCVDGESNPTPIAYAELELIKSEQKDFSWESECVWNSGKNLYYYLPTENKIYSDLWPTNLAVEPRTKTKSPVEFMESWEAEFSERILKSLANPTGIKAIVLAQAIELPETQAKEFASDLIDSLRRLFWDESPGSPSTLAEENQRLREQLAEAETAIEAMVSGVCEPAPGEATPTSDFLLENTSEISAPGEATPTSDFLLENISEISAPGDTAAHYDFLAENTSETSSPGDTAAHSDFLAENTSETSSPGDTAAPLAFSTKIEAELPPNISKQIPIIRNKLFSLIEKYEQSKKFASKRKEIENLDGNIKTVQERLKELEKFEHLRIGHTICHQRRPMMLGKIIGFDFSQGEMPIVWVKYFKEGELEKTPTSELVSMIFIVEV